VKEADMLEIGAKILVAIVIFLVGYFVGKKNGQRIERAAQSLKETVGKM
jgi:hypothetical protein